MKKSNEEEGVQKESMERMMMGELEGEGDVKTKERKKHS